MCIPFKYLTFTLLTASISCKLMIFLSTWVNIFPSGGTVVIISITWNVFKIITLLVKFFSYMLDMDLRIGIWNISTTNYKCTSFKPVGFTLQTMEFMFMKWVNEESGKEGRWCFIFGKELTAAGIWFHGLWYGFDVTMLPLILALTLLTYALLHTNTFNKWDEEVFFV